MKQETDGGPAFARPVVINDGMIEGHGQDGMSLRDYFAGQILGTHGLDVYDLSTEEYDNLAERFYAFADAMLRARSQPTKGV